MSNLNPRQRDILKALLAHDGSTTRQVADATGRSVNGVSQSLDALAAKELVRAERRPGGRGGDAWAWFMLPAGKAEVTP